MSMNLDSLAHPIIFHEDNASEIARRNNLFKQLDIFCEQHKKNTPIFQLCSILLEPIDSFIRMRIVEPWITLPGIEPFYHYVALNTTLLKEILHITRKTLEKSGQLAYLESNAQCSGQLIPDMELSISSATAGGSPLLN